MSKMDDIFKDNLFHHEAKVPNDMWSGIERELINEKRKRRAVYWQMGALSILLLILGTVITRIAIEDNIIVGSETLRDDDANIIANNITSNSNSFASEEIKSSKVYVSGKMPHIQSIRQISTDQSTTINSKESERFNLNTHNHNSKIESKNNESILDDSDKFNLHITGEQTLISNNYQYKSKSGIQNDLIDEINFSSSNEGSKTKLAYNQLDNNQIGILSKSTTVFSINKKLRTSNVKFIDCPEFNRKKGVPYIGMFYSSDISLKELEMNHPFQTEHLNNRLETEKSLYSFTTGIYAGYLTRFNLAIESGAEFSEIMEQFHFEDLKARKTQTVITIDTTFNSNGSYTTNTDTVRIEISGTKEYSITNKYRMINVPVSMAYVIRGKKMDVWLKAGAIFNIYFNTIGHMLNANEKPILLESPLSDGSEIFKSVIKPRYRFSIGFNIHLSEYLNMHIEPYYTSSTGNISSSNDFIKQSYQNLGMKMGVQYRFEN